MSVEELLQNADAAWSANDHDSAIALFAQAAQQRPDDPAIYKKLAGLHREKGDLAKRIDALLDAAEAHGRRGEALKGIATAKLARSLDKTHARSGRVLSALQQRQDAPEQSGSFRLDGGAQALAVIPLVRKSRPKEAAPALTPLSQPPPIIPKIDDLTLDPPKTIPLFSALSADAYQSLVDRCDVVDREAGEEVFYEGDASTAIYVIVEGGVEVLLGEKIVATLGEGEFFGEIGVLTGKPRGATIRTSKKTQLMEIGFAVITDLIGNYPGIVKVLLTFLRRRLSDNVLRRSQIFADFSDQERRSLRERFSLIDVDEEAKLIEQGKVSEALYVLIDGRLDVVHQGDAGPKWIAQLTPGQVCGEISLITQLPAVAEVRAPEKSIVLALPAEGFSELVQNHPQLLAEATRLAGARMEALAKERQPGKPELIVLT